MPWIKNKAPSLYFTSNKDVNKITFDAGYDPAAASVCLDRYGIETTSNWAFRVMSEEQAKSKAQLTSALYKASRKEILLAGERYKLFMNAILMTEKATIPYPSGGPKTVNGMTGVNFTTLKHATWAFNKDMIDPTRSMVWSYKLLWEACLLQKQKKGTSFKSTINKFNTSKKWENLSSALQAKKKIDTTSKLLKEAGIELYDAGKQLADAGGAVVGASFMVHANATYALSPVKRFKDDKMIATPHYGKSGFVSEWLDRLALLYVPRKYYLNFQSTNTDAALDTFQHDAYAGSQVPYRSLAWNAFKPAFKDLAPSKLTKRRPYDAVIQQALETESAWSNLGLDETGTKHLFQNGSNVTNGILYYSAFNPVFPYAPNDVESYRQDNGKYFSKTKGWAPFSHVAWFNVGTKKSVIDTSNNLQWKTVLNPIGNSSENGFKTSGSDTFGIAGLHEICREVADNYPVKQYNKGGSPYAAGAIWSFLRTGPSNKSWGMKAPWTTKGEAQSEADAESLLRWKERLNYLWKFGLNMGCSATGDDGLKDIREAFVFHDGNTSEWKDTSSAITNNIKQKLGSSKKPSNLLNPLYRVETSGTMSLFFRLIVFMLDNYYKGVIPEQANEGGAKISPFSNSDGACESALYMAIDLAWSVFFEFSSTDKKVQAVKKENASVPKDSSAVVSGKGTKGQILENMQCFMLNLVDVFAKFHTEPTAGMPYAKVTGDNTNIFNLLGYKPATTDMMLRMTSPQLARMQPRIKLYKERVVYKKNSNIVLKRETVEVAGPFATHTSIKNIEDSLAQGSGRNLGGGIRELTLKEGSGDMVNSDVPSDDHIEISFLFNTLQEIFLNFPRYDDNGNHTGFPYGVQPKHAHLKPEDVPASYAELVFPSSRGQMDEYIQVVNTFREEFNIILELGWSPPDNLKNLTPYEKAVFDKLRENTLYRTFILSPIDSDFNFTNEGQVELVATYKGIARYQQAKTINRLFPIAGISNSAKLSEDKDVIAAKKTIVKYTNQKKGKVKGKSSILSAAESASLARATTLIKDKIDIRQAGEFDNFVREQLDKLMKMIFDVDTINSDGGNIYIIHVPTALLGARGNNISDGVLKWQTTRDIELIKQFPKNVTRSTGRETRKGYQRDISAKVMDAAKKTSKANNPETNSEKKKMETSLASLKQGWTGSKENLKKEIEKIRQKYKSSQSKISKVVQKAVNNTLEKKGTEQINKNTADTWPIYFMFFGDVVSGVFDFAQDELEELQARINEVVGNGKSTSANINFKKNIHEHVRMILGSVKVPIVSGGKAINHNINIADLPMTTHFFTQFITDVLITPGAYGITKIDFCERLLKRLIFQYFNSTCFYAGSEIAKTSPQMHYFTIPQTAKRKRYSVGLWNHHHAKGMGWGTSMTRADFKQKMIKIEKLLNSKPELSKAPNFKYAFLGTRSFAEGKFDYKKDLEQNIHHFYFGAGEGLVKTVSFKSEELEHMTEAIFYQDVTMPGSEIDAFIPRIFNVDVTMIGNTLFRPGHTFYLDPTMGTMLGSPGAARKGGIDIIKNTGLGGYFYIASIETRIAPGVYETTIEGIKTGVAKNKDRARTAGFNAVSAEELMEKLPPVNVPNQGGSSSSGGFLSMVKKGASIVMD
tara:strand:+ start:11486 stop:16354 length:4869 start_codon:yes stop_codon:yes gene_type:complete